MAKFVTMQSLPMYTHKKSPHKYSFPQLLSCVLLKIYIRNISYRDLEELLLSSESMCRVLGLKAVPHYSTLSRAHNRVSDEQIQRLLEKVVELVATTKIYGSWVFACDSTGFKEDAASFYYAQRSGKKRRRWIKATYLLDTSTQICVSQIINRGPSWDAPELVPLEKRSTIRPAIEVMDRGFDGKGNFRLSVPFRIIPPIRRGGSIKSWRRTLTYILYLLTKGMGVYGKRWMCETMISVIKRKFSDSIRERKEENKKKSASLMAIAYNIHVIVREGKKNRFFFIAFLISARKISLQQSNVISLKDLRGECG